MSVGSHGGMTLTEKNLSQRYFVHHKPHMDRPELGFQGIQ
jgi:hypothetical protein